MSKELIGYTLAVGNAFSGITLIGLYDSHEEALDATWEIVPVYKSI